MITKAEKPYKKQDIENILHPLVKHWFFNRFKEFSLPQLYGVMEIHSRNNILVSAPTGATKTLTAFLSVLNELVDCRQRNALEDKVYCIYISPLKALNEDIKVNLLTPLKEMEDIIGKKLGIRIGVRTGDTTPYEKSKMVKKPPHILITTPESLAIVLASIKMKENLHAVEWCIIDEIHALADNKRGVHLSLSLERLQRLTPHMTRVGLSATIAPLEEIAKYLVGYEGKELRSCKIIDVAFLKKMDLKVLSPVPDLIDTEHHVMHGKMYELIHNLVQDHQTTLVFTNTRAATERVVNYLKEKFPKDYDDNIGAHHGSLSKSHRHMIESRMRKGELKVIASSTSLELGIDIGSIDLVICLGSPKSVARFMQRCLPYDAEILTSTGEYLKIGDIVEKRLDVQLISYNEKQGFVKNKIHEYQKNPPQKLYCVETYSGEILRCTKNHPVLTKRGWIKAKNLTKEDKVAGLCTYIDFEKKEPYLHELLPSDQFFIENRDNFFQKTVKTLLQQNKISLKQFAKKFSMPYSRLIDCRRITGRKKSIRLDYFLKVSELAKTPRNQNEKYLPYLKSKSHFRTKLPLRLTSELMWLAGIIATDGCIVKTSTKSGDYFHIKIGNMSRAIIYKSKSILNSLGFTCHQYTREDGFISLECGSKVLAYLMFSLGIPYKNKTGTVTVGEPIYRLSSELQHAYLEGIFEGDGNFNKLNGAIRIFTASPKFSQGLHRLFHRLGYSNNVNKGKSKQSAVVKKLRYRNIYTIAVTSQNDVDLFLHRIPAYADKAKNAKQLIRKIVRQPKRNLPQRDKYIHWLNIRNILIKKNAKPTYNLTLVDPNNNFIVGNIVTHNSGRAGHGLHDTVKARIIVLDRDDLVECAVLLKSAIERKIDKIHIPTHAMDVLAQQIMGMAIEQRWNAHELFKLITQSYCYHHLRKKDFTDIIEYLAGRYISLEDRHIYAKIWYDEDTGEIGKRGKMSRVIHMTNIGTIPDESFITVKVGQEPIGKIDEGFLERLKRGDVFVLGGDKYEFLYARGMTAQVKVTVDRPPTIPHWVSEMLPLSFDLALEIGRFRRHINDLFCAQKTKKEIMAFIDDYLYVDANAAESLYRYCYEQFRFAQLPSHSQLIVEHYNNAKDKRKYTVFHSLYGRRVNDCLSRAIAFAIARTQHRDVDMGITDNGFYIASDKHVNVLHAFKLLKSEELRKVLDNAIDQSEVLKRRFRHCATRALMILRNYMGRQKRVGRQQVSSMILINAVKRISPNFSILREARREVLEDLMDITSTKKVLEGIEKKKIKIKEIQVDTPSPFAFNIVLQGYTDILKIEDKVEFLRRMHKRVLSRIT